MRKNTRTKEHSRKSKKRESHKPVDKFEKEDQQKHNKKKDEEDKENYKKINKIGEDDEKQKNLNVNKDVTNKKRSLFETFVESIDSEVNLRCKKMATEAAVLASQITKAERLWIMQLPKCVREMNVKEFVEKYNANVNLVLQTSLTTGPHEKPATISAPNEGPIANQKETDDAMEKQKEKLEKEAIQTHQIPPTAATPPTSSSKEAVPQVAVQSFLQQYFTNPSLTVDERKNQINFIVKQMQCLERILAKQGKYGNKN